MQGGGRRERGKRWGKVRERVRCSVCLTHDKYKFDDDEADMVEKYHIQVKVRTEDSRNWRRRRRRRRRRGRRWWWWWC
eukprot:767023-Hanusia_phi.AAC.6